MPDPRIARIFLNFSFYRDHWKKSRNQCEIGAPGAVANYCADKAAAAAIESNILFSQRFYAFEQ